MCNTSNALNVLVGLSENERVLSKHLKLSANTYRGQE